MHLFYTWYKTSKTGATQKISMTIFAYNKIIPNNNSNFFLLWNYLSPLFEWSWYNADGVELQANILFFSFFSANKIITHKKRQNVHLYIDGISKIVNCDIFYQKQILYHSSLMHIFFRERTLRWNKENFYKYFVNSFYFSIYLCLTLQLWWKCNVYEMS